MHTVSDVIGAYYQQYFTDNDAKWSTMTKMAFVVDDSDHVVEIEFASGDLASS